MVACVRGKIGSSRGSGSGPYPPNSALSWGKGLQDWFKPRRYRHFDRPVGEDFASKAQDPSFVDKHPFSPLIRYVKIERRYRKAKAKTEDKRRPIMFASHRDACILNWYAICLNARLEDLYAQHGISDSVIAYRRLGLGNYDFAAEAYAFAKDKAPVTILAFDVTSFFDTLDHRLLKQRLKQALGAAELSADWYQVFRAMTRYHYVLLDELKSHEKFGPRIATFSREPIASVAELKAGAITFHGNPSPGCGIPQGTPLSAAFSNLYMIDFDRRLRAYADSIGGFYRRYSDDILLICPSAEVDAAEAKVGELIGLDRLQLNLKKTERTLFDPASSSGDTKPAQYLGFLLSESGVSIRGSSLSRQWRKMRWAVKRTRKAAERAIGSGASQQVYTKRLRRRFTAVPVRNFSSYARRSAKAFDDCRKVRRQLRRFEHAVEREIRALKLLEPQARQNIGIGVNDVE